MHVEAAKSLNAAEANENERRWNETKIDRKNEDLLTIMTRLE